MVNKLFMRLVLILLLVYIYKCLAAINTDSLNCNFEDGFCNWKQDKSDDFDWTRLSGETPSHSTGPKSDRTSGDGFYVYIETTRKDGANDEARLISPKKDAGQYCLSFWYHMYGSHINRLTVSKTEDANTTVLFMKTGPQGQKWILGQIQFEANKTFQIVIEGKAKKNNPTWFGDIAIDDIAMFSSEKCPTAVDTSDCNFEYGLCNWIQDETDDFDCRRFSGKTPTNETGPDFDHTSGDGFYLYIETTPKNGTGYLNNYEARLISPLKDSGQYCLSFWYHMYGIHINRLRVLIKEVSDTKELFKKIGPQGQKWILGQIQVETKETFQIVIEGKTRDHRKTWFGDIAIDDIVMFSSEKCPPGCSDPTPSTGFANAMNNEIGSVVQITCQPGYRIAGSSSIMCLANGSWSDRPVCQLIDCMMPTFDRRIIVKLLEGTTYNLTIILDCVEGFSLIGNTYVTCQAPGDWSTKPYCVIKNCSDPTLESGNINSTNFQYGSIIKVGCIQGYKLIGNSQILCQADSSWNDSPVCDQIDCGTRNITHGQFNAVHGTTFGKTATQSCDSGYAFAGDKKVTCLETGWNGIIAMCTVVDAEASALIAVYVTIPLVVIVFAILLSFIIWKKRRMQCTKAKDDRHKGGKDPTIRYSSETHNGYALKNKTQKGEEEPIPQDEEYAIVTEERKTETGESVYYNTFDITCKVDKDIEHHYDHTNNTPKLFSDKIYSHISRSKSGTKDETNYVVTANHFSGNAPTHTEAQSEDNSYDHLSIKDLNKAMQQQSENTIQEQESEYEYATAGLIDDAETGQNNYSHLKDVKIKKKSVEKEISSNDDCEYSNVMKRNVNNETTGELNEAA